MIHDLEVQMKVGADILHLEHIWTGWLGLGNSIPTMLNVHSLYQTDLPAEAVKGFSNRLAAWRLRRSERYLIRKHKNISVLSASLAANVRKLSPACNMAIVPFSIDASLYPYIPPERRTSEHIISLIGTMGWAPSHTAAIRLLKKLWPEIKKQLPSARVRIIGWSARTVLQEYLNFPDVEIIENVPDIRSYFEQTGVMLYAPDRGSGMKVKILEAFAYGVPVVTTSDGVEGLAALDGTHASICDDDAGLISRTVKLLSDRARQESQRLAARELIETTISPQVMLDRLETFYADILGRWRMPQ